MTCEDIPHKPVLTASNISKSYGNVLVLKDFMIGLYSGSIHGLVGFNGTGKTTLFDIVSGFTLPDKGSVLLYGREVIGYHPHRISRLGLGRTFQDMRLFRDLTVLDNVTAAVNSSFSHDPLGVIMRPLQAGEDRRERRADAFRCLQRVGLHSVANSKVAKLSWGQMRLVSIARFLAMQSQVCLLDEPTAGLSTENRHVVECILENMRDNYKCVCIISHDLPMVLRLCDRITILRKDKEEKQPFVTGKPENLRDDPELADLIFQNREISSTTDGELIS